MFDNDKFITKGIQEEIPLELQLFLWNCIDTLKEQGQELDYLQSFELTKERSDDIFFQKIEHRQGVSEYSKSYRVISNELVEAKIFVIDDGTYSTMMLAEEY
ncbi:DUF960 domain-containing protein [Clostridium scatologenes]|uniref:DUF960 domain-containing protein n=1 Tax=Clostridium scatologenes TaxID=1548 RepID=A0A0E3GRT3_CLOSL|nr:DUF960 domain-containing protein [Clostridium scatologenes]AKA70871.1 hypothetical protein CSCA_3746 [Clostridium scatologenes]